MKAKGSSKGNANIFKTATFFSRVAPVFAPVFAWEFQANEVTTVAVELGKTSHISLLFALVRIVDSLTMEIVDNLSSWSDEFRVCRQVSRPVLNFGRIYMTCYT